MPLPELPRSQSVDNRLPPSDSALPPTPPLPVTLPTALPAMPATPTPTTVPQTALASAAAPPPLDVNTIVFLQQQLERVVAFMRTVDARLDSLERTTLHLVSQQERLNKQLEVRQQRPVTSTLLSTSGGLASGGGGGGAMETGGICPLCGLHFPDSNELQMHAQTCLDKRESRDRRSSSTGGAGASSNQGKDGGIFGRFLGKH